MGGGLFCMPQKEINALKAQLSKKENSQLKTEPKPDLAQEVLKGPAG